MHSVESEVSKMKYKTSLADAFVQEPIKGIRFHSLKFHIPPLVLPYIDVSVLVRLFDACRFVCV